MREEFEYVVKNSKYVKINNDRLDDCIKALGKPNYIHWSKELSIDLNEEEWILLAFIIESMNFCFWKKPKWKIEYNGEEMSGSNALFYSIINEVENNPNFLNIDYLYSMTQGDFKKIFKTINGEIPLFKERYNNFREVIQYIKNNKNFYNEIYSIKKDKDLLQFIVSNFSSFDDKSIYKGKTIHFNKRATLLTNDLFYLSNKIRNNLGNVNNLSGCADYGIPRTFRDYGILEYSPELSDKVDNEIEIPHNSEMEIEIRANMLYVIEIMKQFFQDNAISINSVELDNLIWLLGKNNKDRKSIAHHTITIYY